MVKPSRTVRVAGTVAATLLLGVAPAAPIPGDHLRPPLYFPTTVGTKWVYQLDDGREYTDVVTKVERGAGGEVIVSVGRETPDGKVHPGERYVVSARGLLRVEGLGVKPDRPEWLLKLPYKVDEAWETGGWREDEFPIFLKQKDTHTSAGEEKVTVPAGTYTALRVTTKYGQVGHLPPQGPGAHWYAPRVGAVKMTLGKRVWELKSFTPGDR